MRACVLCVCLFFFSSKKHFISVLSLLFIANKYLSTGSLAPRCVAVIHYFCHLAVLSPAPSTLRPPPLLSPPPTFGDQMLLLCPSNSRRRVLGGSR